MKVNCLPSTAFLIILFVHQANALTQTPTTIFSFQGANGSRPEAALVKGSDGNFYGTTGSGGVDDRGTVFKITPAGVLTTLAEFRSTNGSTPIAPLVQASDGNFYGTTYGGGTKGDHGTVFRITPQGQMTNLVHFQYTNGSGPAAALVEIPGSQDLSFFGTTVDGGTNGYGTVFKLVVPGDPNQTPVLQTVVSFDTTNGSAPATALIRGKDGNFYGTTEYGKWIMTGTGGSSSGHGNVYRLKMSTNVAALPAVETLFDFSGPDGSRPKAPLVQDANGDFYGTTSSGGSNDLGTVFKLVVPAAGTNKPVLQTLVHFGGTNNGSRPDAGLLLANDDRLYGTTWSGGYYGHGSVFTMTTNGVFTKLVDFELAQGASPQAALIQGDDGYLYGTTWGGGGNRLGAVFRLNVFLPPPEMIAVSGGTLPPSSELSGTAVSDFRIGKYEVTYEEWTELRSWAATNGYDLGDLVPQGGSAYPIGFGGPPNGTAVGYPVTDVNWYEAVKWCNAKSEKEGLTPVYRVAGTIFKKGESDAVADRSADGYRLPAEAEWEWAARGGVSGKGYKYSGSDDANEVAWYEGNNIDDWAKRVGKKTPNELGIHDMSGNVWEWCEDTFDLQAAAYRIIRGGSWGTGQTNGVAVSFRNFIEPNFRGNGGSMPPPQPFTGWGFVGFRLAQNAPTLVPVASPTPTPAPASITKVTLVPAKRTVKAGKTARSVKLIVMVANDSMDAVPVTVALSAEPAGIVTLPQSSMEMTVPGKKSAKQKAKTKRQSFTVLVPPTASGDVTIKAAVGALSASSTLRVQAAKK